MKVLVATHNRDKLTEILEGFDIPDINLVSLDEFPSIGEIIEDGKTLEENALIKARTCFNETGIPSLADDTGLEVSALDGAPGIFTARYAGEGCSYRDNVEKMLEEMSTVPIPNRTARFRTSMAFVAKDTEICVEGYVDGLISRSIKGDNGFGYDPIFFIPELDMTFAEMSIEQKQEVSHRGNAIKAMKTELVVFLENTQKTKEMA